MCGSNVGKLSVQCHCLMYQPVHMLFIQTDWGITPHMECKINSICEALVQKIHTRIEV